MKKKIRKFTDLKVWQEGHRLVILVYRITRRFPKEERYSLVDQMRRAVSSITANVAEGFGRRSYKEKLQFYYQAQGSLVELKNFVYVARDVEYTDAEITDEVMNLADSVHGLLQGLIRSTRERIRNQG